MTRADQLRALAARCEAGESGREIDAAVWHVMGFDLTSLLETDGLPRFSTSIDAQQAMGVRITACRIHNVTRPAGWWFAAAEYAHDKPWLEGEGATEPLARLAAILRALAAKEDA